jgi:hypothetical protein
MELAENFATLIKGAAIAAGTIHVLLAAFHLQRQAVEVAAR